MGWKYKGQLKGLQFRVYAQRICKTVCLPRSVEVQVLMC